MASKKDYYQILGVAKNASESDLKAAYKKMAREHHPDMVADSDKKAAEERFKEINEAYQVLSDPQKRQMYDQFGHVGTGQNSGFGQGAGTGGQWGPFTYSYSGAGAQDFDPFDIFEEFFGFRGFGGARKPKKGKNLYYELRVDFAEAISGVEKEVRIESGTAHINIPKGVRDGTELRFAGKGMPGPNNVPNGDLFITIRVATPREFQRVGDNLGTSIEISFVTAILGGEVEVPVVSLESKNGVGTAKLKIPGGTQSGTQFRLGGKGMPRLQGSGRGDVVVRVLVAIPKKISKGQRKLLEEYHKI